MSTPHEPTVVYVVTDAEPSGRTIRANVETDPLGALWPLIRHAVAVTIVAVPFLACTALLFGVLLGWSAPVLLAAALFASPVLANLLDLLGARVGWPPLAWTATRIAERHGTTSKENPTDG